MRITQTKLILFSSLFFVLFDNFVFFKAAYQVFHNLFFMIGLGGLLFVVMNLFLSIISNKWTIKPILILLFVTSSIAQYYMLSYGVILDDKMVQNIIETDTKEVYDLLNLSLFLQIFILGLLPSYIIFKLEIKTLSFKEELFSRIKLFLFNLFLIPFLYILFSKSWVSFFRMHKTLRMYTNPSFYIYSIGKYVKEKYFTTPMKFKHIGLDAKLEQNNGKRKLIIMVLGEAARYDHFELNGYKRDTNPELLKIKSLINYPNVHSCGTETAVSVPCMFSPYDRSDYSDKKAKHTDSVIDVLNRAGVNLLWRDNNSDSKGVAVRIKNYEDFNHKKINGYCNNFECYDEVLLYGLQKWVNEINNSKPIFIVLHQKGSHGPAYYKRYPKKYGKFNPVCESNQLQNCKQNEVINAYDNTIVYTDKFLSEVIKFLQNNEKKYQVAMYYVADHGESLGENGIYLHGLPYFIAPDVQKHPASVAWFSKDFDINQTCAKQMSNNDYSQDNLFSTILGLVGVTTKVYRKNMDIYQKCRIKE